VSIYSIQTIRRCRFSYFKTICRGLSRNACRLCHVNVYSISDYQDDTVEIYTKVIPQGSHKNINKYHLTGIDILFSEKVKSLIHTLGLVEHRNSIWNIDYLKYGEVRNAGLRVLVSEKVKSLIHTLGLVEHRNSIWNIDYLKYGEVRNAGLSIYSDALFDEISKAVRYQYSTIVSFNLLLKDIGKEDALYIDIFQKNDVGK